VIHVVEENETLGVIANRFGTTVAALLQMNPQIKNKDLIKVGQQLFVPGEPSPQDPAEEVAGLPAEVGGPMYMIRSGDTLGKVAAHLGITLAKLLGANPQIVNPDRVRPGDMITVPATASIEALSTVTAPVLNGLPAWLAIAHREMDTGIDEIRGGADNPRIVEYHQTTSLKASDDETAWCSSFVNWCVVQSGIAGTNSALARSWIGWGQVLERPERGAVTVFRREGGPTRGHVAFYWSRSGDRVLVLGGNQGNQVSIKSYPAADLLGFRWPKS
jgi:uncharacterized protein (TIGR02594 family)